jgi:hypothetical protein
MSAPDQLKDYVKNLPKLGDIMISKGKSFIHNPELLNKQSLLMASLVLVINRSMIANYSAIQAKDTPEGPYRTHEAYRTTIREFLGFTGGFLVLRQLQSMIKKGFKNYLDIEDKTNPNIYPMLKNIKAWYKNPVSGKIELFKPRHWDSLTPKVNLENNKKAQKFIRLIENIPGVKFADNAAKEAFLLQMYKLGPIILASIPTVILAGMLLERFTRDHANQVADYIGRLLGGGNPQAAKISAAATQASFSAMSAPPPLANQGLPAGLPFGRANVAPPSWTTPKRPASLWAGSPFG